MADDEVPTQTPSPSVAAMPQPATVVKPPHPPTVDNTELLEATRSAGSVGRRPRISDLLDDTIIAKPLSMGEGFFGLKPKNPDVILRAIAFNVSTNDGPSYLRYEQAKSQGYANATVADVAGTVPTSFVHDSGQRICNGDLIMMKISRSLYRGALKWKDQQAIRATKRIGAIDQGNAEIRKAMEETNMPPRLARKLQPFSPSPSEFAKDFGERD